MHLCCLTEDEGIVGPATAGSGSWVSLITWGAAATVGSATITPDSDWDIVASFQAEVVIIFTTVAEVELNLTASEVDVA